MPNHAETSVRSDDIFSATVREFLAATAAKTPTPGGGAVAALTGALASALAQMALQYTVGKKKYEAFHAELDGAIGQLQKAAALLAELIDEDIAAYSGLSPFMKLSMEQRLADSAYLPAVVAAIRVPQTVGGLGLHILELCQELRERTNTLLISDLGIAATLAHATVHASEMNVLINLSLLPDPAEAARLRVEMRAQSDKADAIYQATRDFVCNHIS